MRLANMLTLMQRARIAQKKKVLKLSTRQLADFLGVKYGTLSMVLCGSYENKDVEKVVLDWLRNKNENK